MPDFDERVTRAIEWEKFFTAPAGTRIRVIIGASNTILDKTVPAGKTLAKGYMQIVGELVPE